MEQVKLYFKSDFKVFLSASDNWAVPFRIKFWTGSPSSSFIACHHGTEYNNCKLLEDGRLMVAFDDHKMGRGKLMMEVHLFLSDENYRTGVCDQVIAPQAVVCQVTAEESRTDVMSASAGMGAGRYAVEAGIVMHYGDTVKVTSEYQALVYDNAQFNGGPLAAQMRGTAVWVCKESEKTVWVGCSGPGPQELPVEIISAIVKDAEVVLDMQGEKTLDVVCELPPFYQKGEKGDKGEPGAKGEPGMTTEEHDALVAATNDANRAAVIAMSATQRANASADAADSVASSASSATVRANRSAQMADAAAKRAEDSVLDLDKLEQEVGKVKESMPKVVNIAEYVPYFGGTKTCMPQDADLYILNVEGFTYAYHSAIIPSEDGRDTEFVSCMFHTEGKGQGYVVFKDEESGWVFKNLYFLEETIPEYILRHLGELTQGNEVNIYQYINLFDGGTHAPLMPADCNYYADFGLGFRLPFHQGWHIEYDVETGEGDIMYMVFCMSLPPETMSHVGGHGCFFVVFKLEKNGKDVGWRQHSYYIENKEYNMGGDIPSWVLEAVGENVAYEFPKYKSISNLLSNSLVEYEKNTFTAGAVEQFRGSKYRSEWYPVTAISRVFITRTKYDIVQYIYTKIGDTIKSVECHGVDGTSEGKFYYEPYTDMEIALEFNRSSETAQVDIFSPVVKELATKQEVAELGSEVGKVETATSELGGIVETLIKQSVDEPVEQTIGTTPRTTANGEAIKSGLAVVDKVKGNTIVQDSELVSVNADALVSKGDGFEESLPINIADIKDAEGNQLFPNGLCSAGTAHDEIDWANGKAIKRVGAVDFGTLNWSKTLAGYFASLVSSAMSGKSGAGPKVVCDKFVSVKDGFFNDANSIKVDGGIGMWVNNKSIVVRYDAITDASAFKEFVNGVIAYYELAEPIVVDIPKRKSYYKVENGGTEQITADGASAPMLADIAYRYSGAAAMLAELHNADNLL